VAARHDMSEPMSSFGEWKCSECGRVQHVETRQQSARRVAAWPSGWTVRHSRTFALVVCPSCVTSSRGRTARGGELP
jgi:Fe2+ or Zn2+ uptake regulation protein